MTEQTPSPADQPHPPVAPPPPAWTPAAPPPPAWSPVPAGPGALAPGTGFDGPIGTVRSTGTCILLTIVTLGFYTWYWYFQVHQEMKRHTGNGIDGGLALVLAIVLGIVLSFLTPSEVGAMYERKGMPKPVSGATGLWALLLGWFFFVGLIVWFVKTNGALNAYWRSQGARG